MVENNLDPSLNHEYLGEGVYVHDEGFQIAVKANHHMRPTDTVWLEKSTFVALVRWVNRVHPEWVERLKND